MRDYLDWHDGYERPGSPLQRRLEVVIDLLREALDATPPGPVRVLSICAGQGADVLAVAETHPRGRDLEGRLVELDPRNAAVARQRIGELGLVGLDVLEADAGRSDAYDGAVPAELVLVCGVFGNISDADIERTIRYLPSLCAPGASVLWTRHPRQPAVIDRIQGWLEAAGFDNDRVVVPDDGAFGVGAAHLAAPPDPFRPGEQLFDFLR